MYKKTDWYPSEMEIPCGDILVSRNLRFVLPPEI